MIGEAERTILSDIRRSDALWMPTRFGLMYRLAFGDNLSATVI